MFPVVDRLCFALARQCRKKNNTPTGIKRTSSELSETVKLRFRTRKTLGALRTSPRRHSNVPQVDLYPKLPIVAKSIPAYIPAADKVRWVGSPPCWWMTRSPFGSSCFGSRIRYLTSTNVDSKGKIQVRLRVGWSPL